MLPETLSWSGSCAAELPYRGHHLHGSRPGALQDFGRFLAEFENEYPYFRVENIELTSQSSLTDSRLELDESEMLSLKFDMSRVDRPSLIKPYVHETDSGCLEE